MTAPIEPLRRRQTVFVASIKFLRSLWLLSSHDLLCLNERCKEYFIRYWNQYQGLASPSADTTFHQYIEHHVQNGMKHVPIDARRQIDSILQEIASLFGGAC